MHHPLDWFTDRIGTTIRRHRTGSDTPSYWPITDEKTAQYHFELQSDDIWYDVKPRIHKMPVDCPSCEG